MRKPDKITVTTFWMDWLFLPIILGAVWLTLRWALSDLSLARELGVGEALPAWVVPIPLFISATAFVIIGLGMLIREEYWEFRALCSGLILCSFSCIIGAGLILFSFLQGDSGFGVPGLLNFIGLVLMSLTIVLPARVDHSSVDKVIRSAHLWFVLLAVCVGFLMAGMLLGFPYNFPRFALGFGALFFFGLGLAEIPFKKTSFPWLICLWKPHIGGREFHDNFPESGVWRIQGLAKLLVGISIAVILIIVSLS